MDSLRLGLAIGAGAALFGSIVTNSVFSLTLLVGASFLAGGAAFRKPTSSASVPARVEAP